MDDATRADWLQAAIEVTETKSDPLIEDAYDAARVSVPRNAWLSAVATACFSRAYLAAHATPPPAGQREGMTMDDAEKRAIDAVRVYLRFVESKRDVPGAVICDFVQHRNAALAALLKEYDAATPPPADDEAGRLRELLRRMVERYAPHSSSCGRFDESGKVVITEASCQCDLLAKEARAALAHRPGDTQAADEAGRLRAALLVYRTAQRRMLERWADGDAAVRQELWRDLHACEEVADEALAHRPGGGLAGRDAT